jgi:hypothetical protein
VKWLLLEAAAEKRTSQPLCYFIIPADKIAVELYLVLVIRWRKIGLLQSAAKCLLSGENLCIFPEPRLLSAYFCPNTRVSMSDRQTIERKVLVILEGYKGCRHIAHTRAHGNEDGLRLISFTALCAHRFQQTNIGEGGSSGGGDDTCN